MEEEGFIPISFKQSGELLEEIGAMRIAGCGCIVRTRSVIANQAGLASSESVCFVPGVKIKEIKENEKVVGHRLVSDTRKL